MPDPASESEVRPWTEWVDVVCELSSSVEEAEAVIEHLLGDAAARTPTRLAICGL